MQRDEMGTLVLRERPLVDEKVAERAFGLLKLRNERRDSNMSKQQLAYANFLQTHNLDPNECTPLQFLSYPDLSYVMTGYPQYHDCWQVLTGSPPTVLGELALKWFELMQPLAALSAAGVSLRLSSEERALLWNVYFPWVIRVGVKMKENALMRLYYEEELAQS
eukprot:CCRYP_015017-RA/>CCRYP_015017-RA protein AED:0.30 eAED:0.32 QI:0/0/0/1/0/0/2/0/163